MEKKRRIAVFYQYYEASNLYRDNFIFFLAAAYREDLDFFVVMSSACSVALPVAPNINYITAPNINMDFGSYCFALRQFQAVDSYDAFIFVNSTVRGPFLSGALGEVNWADIFVDRLNSDVGLVGCTLCLLPETSPTSRRYRESHPSKGQLTHVQTTSYALSAVALKYLLKSGFYDVHEEIGTEDNKSAVVTRYEIGLSQAIKTAGWNIGSILKEFDGVDYRLPHDNPNMTSDSGDPSLENGYFGRTLHPSEAIFIKTNRNMLSATELASHTYTALRFGRRARLHGWAAADDLEEKARSEVYAAAGQLTNRPSALEWQLLRMFRKAKEPIKRILLKGRVR